jgi:hypothetical protein
MSSEQEESVPSAVESATAVVQVALQEAKSMAAAAGVELSGEEESAVGLAALHRRSWVYWTDCSSEELKRRYVLMATGLGASAKAPPDRAYHRVLAPHGQFKCSQVCTAAAHASTGSLKWLENMLQGHPSGLQWPRSLPVVNACRTVCLPISFDISKPLNELLANYTHNGAFVLNLPLVQLQSILDASGFHDGINGLVPLGIQLLCAKTSGLPGDITSLGGTLVSQTGARSHSFTQSTNLHLPITTRNAAYAAASRGAPPPTQLVAGGGGSGDVRLIQPMEKTATLPGGGDLSGFVVPANDSCAVEQCIYTAPRYLYEKLSAAHFWLGVKDEDWDTLRQRDAEIDPKKPSDVLVVCEDREDAPGIAPSPLTILVLNNLRDLRIGGEQHSPAEWLSVGVFDEKTHRLRVPAKVLDQLIERQKQRTQRDKVVLSTTPGSHLQLRLVPRGLHQGLDSLQRRKAFQDASKDQTLVNIHVTIQIIAAPIEVADLQRLYINQTLKQRQAAEAELAQLQLKEERRRAKARARKAERKTRALATRSLRAHGKTPGRPPRDKLLLQMQQKIDALEAAVGVAAGAKEEQQEEEEEEEQEEEEVAASATAGAEEEEEEEESHTDDE